LDLSVTANKKLQKDVKEVDGKKEAEIMAAAAEQDGELYVLSPLILLPDQKVALFSGKKALGGLGNHSQTRLFVQLPFIKAQPILQV
jgi:hypothetical protein